MISKPKLTIIATFVLATIIVAQEPGLAQEQPGEELDKVDWLGLIEDLLQFFANVLEKSAQGVRGGTELLSEMFE